MCLKHAFVFQCAHSFFFFQVKIWFQNRRTKWKKQEGISNAEAAEHKHTPEKPSSSKGKSSKSSKNPAKPCMTDTPTAPESGNIPTSINTSVLTVPLTNGKHPGGELSNELSIDAMDTKPNPPLPENFNNPTISRISEEVSLSMDVMDNGDNEMSISEQLESSRSPSHEQSSEHVTYPFLHNQMKYDGMSEPNSPIRVADSVVNCNGPFTVNSTIDQEMLTVEASNHQ